MAESIRAEALLGRGRYEDALAAFDRMVALTPDDTSARYRRAFVRLLLCDFAGGWEDYETRWDEDSFRDGSALITNLPIVHLFDRRLRVEDLVGQRVLLIAEQGIGDHVMFASIVPDLARVAGEVTFVCESRLARLFSSSFPGVRVTGASEAEVRLSEFDRLVPLGSLGRLWRNQVGDFPGTRFLAPREAVTARWAETLGPKTGRLRIGISWRGGTRRTGSQQRSLELDQLAPILDLADCEFINLQYGDVADELAAFNAGRAAPIRAFPKAEIDDFEDLAGLIENLDLVISVQTAVVHLSGALGKPCLTLIPFRPEWRYTAHAEHPPWYGSVRLFRQPERGDWASPIGRIAEEVSALRG